VEVKSQECGVYVRKYEELIREMGVNNGYERTPSRKGSVGSEVGSNSNNNK